MAFKTASITFSCEKGLKSALIRAAEKNVRSLSGEIVARLQESVKK